VAFEEEIELVHYDSVGFMAVLGSIANPNTGKEFNRRVLNSGVT